MLAISTYNPCLEGVDNFSLVVFSFLRVVGSTLIGDTMGTLLDATATDDDRGDDAACNSASASASDDDEDGNLTLLLRPFIADVITSSLMLMLEEEEELLELLAFALVLILLSKLFESVLVSGPNFVLVLE